jgi:hypothetical protein
MLFTISVSVLVIAILFRQATLGFYSALLMAVLTVCCGVAAMGMHEWVAAEFVSKYVSEDYAMAVGLAVPFGMMLFVLRIVADKLMPRTCLLPAMIDRIGGGICGFFTAMTMVGIASLSLQMLPLGRATLGFQRIPSYAKSTDGTPLPAQDAPERDLWFTPDRFVVEMTSLLSSQVFSSSRNFYREHPDYVGSMGSATAVPSGVSIFAPPNSVTFVSTGEPDVVYSFKKGKKNNNRNSNTPDVPDEYNPIEPRSGYEFRSVRVKLGKSAERKKKHLFTIRQFRLVGQDANGRPHVVPACAIQQASTDESVNRHIRVMQERKGDRPILDDVLSPREVNGEVEVVFEVPTGFQPSFLEYKLGARVDVNFASSQGGTPNRPSPSETDKANDSRTDAGRSGGGRTVAAPVTDGSTSANSSGRSGRRRRGGNVRRATTRADLSFFGDAMPMELKSYQQEPNVEISRGLLKNGHIVGEVAKQSTGSDASITKFAVPSDKRLLQLNTQFLGAKSIFGKALGQAVKVAGNFFVTDEDGARHKIIGKYAIASVNGTKFIEVQYFPEQAGTVGGIGVFSKIKDQYLTGDYTLVYLFLVEPGKLITDFNTGGSATRADDLRSANLVAPK